MNPSPTPTARFVSTGTLPGRDEIRSLVEAAYVHFRKEAGGELADYIPAGRSVHLRHLRRQHPRRHFS